MEPYAIIETGGKQYHVKSGSTLNVERIDAEVGASVEIDAVLAVSDGSSLQVGQPKIENKTVSCSVVEHLRGPKLFSFKKKRRKGYAKKKGHRQELTSLKVETI